MGYYLDRVVLDPKGIGNCLAHVGEEELLDLLLVVEGQVDNYVGKDEELPLLLMDAEPPDDVGDNGQGQGLGVCSMS